MLAVGRGSVKSGVKSVLGGSCSGWKDAGMEILLHCSLNKSSEILVAWLFTSSLI